MTVVRFVKHFTDTVKPQYGWLPDFGDRHPEGVNTGGQNLYTPGILNKPPSYFTNKGQFFKVSPNDNPTYNVPKGQLYVFIEAGYIAEQGNPANWTQTNIDNYSSRIANLDYFYLTDSEDESYTGFVIRADQNLSLYYEVCKAKGIKAKAKGNRNAGSYQGNVYISDIRDVATQNALRAGLVNASIARGQMKIGQLFNKWSTPEFEDNNSLGAGKLNLLNYKDVMINQYGGPKMGNGLSSERWLESVAAIEYAKLGIQDLGLTDTRVCNFVWGNNYETDPGGVGFTAEFRRQVPGGFVRGLFFPTIPPLHNYDLTTFAFCRKTDVMSWNDPATFGTDPTTMADSPTTTYVGNGTAPRRVPISDNNLSGSGERGFPFKPQGGFDYLGDGAKRYEYIWTWPNSQDFQYCPIRLKGTSAWSATNATQLVDCQTNNMPLGLLASGQGATANRHGAFIRPMVDGEYELKLPNGTVVDVKEDVPNGITKLSARTGYGVCIDNN